VLELADGTSLAGEGGQLLYPTWAETAADVEGLALRSEAPATAVRAVVEELARERPDASALRIPVPEGEVLR
jgi:hypothetical protein